MPAPWNAQGVAPFYFWHYFAVENGPNFTDLGYTVFFYGSGATNQFFGDAGADIMYGFGGSDWLYGLAGHDTLFGGDDDGIGAADVNFLYGGSGIDFLYGGDGAVDFLFGGDHKDFLYGGSGNDYFNGGSGDDDMFGGSGNDEFIGGQGRDVMHGSWGIDVVRYSNSGAAVQVDLETGIGIGGDADGDEMSTIENLHGSIHNDVLLGDDLANELFGLGGNDVINGRDGDDMIVGGANSALFVFGDDLTGGGGDDEFVFYTDDGDSTPMSADIIRDFNMLGDDTLVFDVNNARFAANNWSTETVANSEVFGSGVMVTIQDIVGASGQVVAQVFLEGVSGISQSDFMFM